MDSDILRIFDGSLKERLFFFKSLDVKDLSSSVESLAKKTDSLLDAYRLRSERIGQLEAELEALKQRVEGLDGEIERLKEENKVLRMASAIKGDEEKVTESKRRISQLVREIDKCLALLND